MVKETLFLFSLDQGLTKANANLILYLFSCGFRVSLRTDFHMGHRAKRKIRRAERTEIGQRFREKGKELVEIVLMPDIKRNGELYRKFHGCNIHAVAVNNEGPG